jgi:hypothetical protein
MVVLVAIAALGLAACYAPDLRDCSVACTSSTDCARGQVCGSGGWCAAPEVADRCADVVGDAATPPTDAPADARPHVTLHVHVDGPGEIDFGANECRTDCMYSVAIGAAITLDAVDVTDHTFDRWTMGPCMNQTTRSCAFTQTTATNVTGKWH